MNVKLVNAFIEAACEVMVQEAGAPVTRGTLKFEGNPYITEEVTAVIGISGSVRGNLLLSMSRTTALALISRMLGQSVEKFDELEQSGIAELANVVAGAAATSLVAQGHETNITPPLMLLGAGVSISALDLQRLVVQLETPCGEVRLHVAVREV